MLTLDMLTAQPCKRGQNTQIVLTGLNKNKKKYNVCHPWGGASANKMSPLKIIQNMENNKSLLN